MNPIPHGFNRYGGITAALNQCGPLERLAGVVNTELQMVDPDVR